MGNLAARNMASLLFVVVLLTALYRFKLGNRVSLWLGKYSYEIFLFHPLFISFFRDWIANNLLSGSDGSIGAGFCALSNLCRASENFSGFLSSIGKRKAVRK